MHDQDCARVGSLMSGIEGASIRVRPASRGKVANCTIAMYTR